MRRSWIRIWLLAAVLSAALTGCIPRSRGGASTQRGLEAMEQGQYEEAAADFEKAVDQGEDPVPAWRGLGISYIALARYDEAAEALETALSFTDSKMPETIRDIRQFLMTAQYRSGDYAGAIETGTLLNTEQECVEADYYLGASYLAQNNTAMARSCFDQAIALDPNSYLLYLQIYERYEENKLTAVGDEFLQTALSIPAKTQDDKCSIGHIYYHLEKYDEARNAIYEAVEEHYPPAMELMGEIFLAQGDYNNALDMYQTVMEQSGESPEVYNGLALCAIQAEEYDMALNYLEQGLAIADKDSRQPLLFNEIVVYERKLEFSTAKLKAEAYVQQYPTDEAGQKELKFLSTR